MKKLLAFSILALLSCKAISQTYRIQDSSLIANKDLKKAAIIIEQCKACTAELNLYQRQAHLLTHNNQTKDSIITHQGKTISLLNLQIDNHMLQATNFKEQLKLYDSGIKSLEKSLRQQRTKTVLVGIAGTLSSLGLFYLLIKK
jgi:hypothetical protein